MEQSHYWEASGLSASLRNLRLLWNPKVYYRVHKNAPQVPILSQLNPIHTFPPSFLNINPNIISHLRVDLPPGLFPWGFPTKILYASLISPMRAICFAHLILLDFITLMMFGEDFSVSSGKLITHMLLFWHAEGVWAVSWPGWPS